MNRAGEGYETSKSSIARVHTADELREAMADELAAQRWVKSPEVDAAFRAVPRHLFVPPGTPLEVAYATNAAPITKSAGGVNLSSVSAPWLQALMIAQAGIEPGMRVLEVGSGGFNAALLAEVTGKEGLVVTVDIDPDITAFASAALEAAGYGDRVVVVTADAELGVPRYAPYDAVIVTVSAPDVPPAWRDQLACPGGTLVLPLKMNQVTRVLALRRDGDCWRSTSAEMAGFVPMRGTGARQEPDVRLLAPGGGHVILRFDQEPPADPSVLAGAMASQRVTAWAGVTIANTTSFEDLHLWLAGFLPGFCKVAASDAAVQAALGGAAGRWFPFGCTRGDSFAFLVTRKLDGPGEPAFEFGAAGFGPDAGAAAEALAGQVRAWDAAGRDLPPDAYTFWPAGTEIPPLPERTAVFAKNHGTVTVSFDGVTPWRAPNANTHATR